MKRLKSGFSLMEMMVVLLIISIIAAATAPMISKRMISTAKGDSPWLWSGVNGSIAYNINGNNNMTAIIGHSSNDSGTQPRLFIKKENDTNPHIALCSGGNNGPLKILYSGQRRSLLMTNSDIDNLPSQLSVAIGAGSANTGDESVAIGESSGAAAHAVAIGRRSNASQSSGVSVGSGANSVLASIAVGGTARATGTASVALGSTSQATETSAIAIGNQTTALADSAISVGFQTEVDGGSSIAIGKRSVAHGICSIAIGSAPPLDAQNRTSVADHFGICIGGRASVGDEGSVAIGYQSSATSTNSVALGIASEARASGDIAIGDHAKTTNSNNASGATAIGGYAQAYGLFATAVGHGAQTNNIDTISIGRGSSATGRNAIAIGRSPASAIAENSLAIGVGANASHRASTAIGVNAATTTTNQVVLGTASDTVYIPGTLVVGKNSYLGLDSTSRTHIMIPSGHGGNEYHKMIFSRVFHHGDKDDESFLRENGEISNSLIKSLLPSGYNFTGFGSYANQYPTSDKRLKNVGEVFTGGLAEIRKLEPFNYTFKKDPEKTPRVGVMAQDLMKIFPNAVFKGEDGFYKIRMEDMFYAVVNAIKELDSKLTALAEQVKTNTDAIAQLKNTINSQQEEIKELKAQNAEFEKRLAKLEEVRGKQR